MMSFCKKSVHSFLGLTISPTNFDILDLQKPKSSKTNGLGLISATDIDSTFKSPPNVLESTAFKSPSPPPPPPPPPAAPSLFKKDPGGVGFIDYVGGGCTESLGFESCDERRVDDESDELCSRTLTTATTRVTNWRKYNIRERKEVKKFPPPLSSLNHNGQPSFYLRPVRKNGRLELTEVRIDRPEILRAFREDGRLRLHLIRDDDEEEDNDCIQKFQEQECEENQELEDIQEEEDQEIQENQELEDEQEEEVQEIKENQELEDEREEEVQEIQENQEMEDEQEEEVQENDDEEEEIAGEWRFPVTGEGFRRCHELGAHHHRNDYHHHHHHHHQNMHVWRQHCVTTR